MDAKMAWRNIWRNPRRSILTILAVAFATILLVFMLSWQFGSYETMIRSAVRVHTGHLQVQEKTYNNKKTMRKVVADPDAVARQIASLDGIAAHAYRANAFALVSSESNGRPHGRTYGAAVIGIQPGAEARVSTIQHLVRDGAYLHDGDANAALVGKLLAENLHAGPGDELVILGQGRDGSVAATAVTIKGIFSSGEDQFDRNTLLVPLPFFQDVFAMRKAAHEVVILADSLSDVEPIKHGLSRELFVAGFTSLAVLDWQELMPGLVQAIKMDLTGGLIMYVILIIVVAFSIFNTFLMAMFERTREFGVLMAIGTTPGRLARLLVFESISMTTVGITAGILVGGAITLYFQQHGIVIEGASELLSQYGMPERMCPKLSWLSVSIGAGIVLVITGLTALYPAWKIRRLQPVEAMTAV
jgi:ABC-type lipoprotein release transport system permease subunit